MFVFSTAVPSAGESQGIYKQTNKWNLVISFLQQKWEPPFKCLFFFKFT